MHKATICILEFYPEFAKIVRLFLKITWGDYERNLCIRGPCEFVISLKIRRDYWLCFRCYDTHVYRHIRTHSWIIRIRRLHSVPKVLMLTTQQIDIYFISSQYNDYYFLFVSPLLSFINRAISVAASVFDNTDSFTQT